MFVPNSEHFHLMKGILDVAVAIETRHVYKGAEIEWCVSGAAELSEVLELHNLSTSFIFILSPSGFIWCGDLCTNVIVGCMEL